MCETTNKFVEVSIDKKISGRYENAEAKVTAVAEDVLALVHPHWIIGLVIVREVEPEGCQSVVLPPTLA